MVFRVRDVRELRIRGTPRTVDRYAKYFSTRADKVFVWGAFLCAFLAKVSSVRKLDACCTGLCALYK